MGSPMEKAYGVIHGRRPGALQFTKRMETKKEDHEGLSRAGETVF